MEAKITLSQQRIRQWYDYWEGNVYISFSGGKDSTVLRHIVKTTIGVSDVKSVFVNTGLEYPEIQKFVRKIRDEENDVEIIKPNMSFVEVLEKYGYPVVSKEISQVIEYARLSKTVQKKTYIDAMSKMNNEFLDKNSNPSKYNYPKWRFLIDAPFKISSKCCDVLKKDLLKNLKERLN